jgi:hypothetical protein
MHSILRRRPRRIHAGFIALGLNLREFSTRGEGNPVDHQDGSVRVIVAHDQGCSCHRLFSDAAIIFDCHG